MKIRLKIIILGLLLVLTEIAMASKIIFRGGKQDVFFWVMVDIKQNDSLIKTVDLYNRKTVVDSLKPGIYQVVFFSRFADRQSFTVDLIKKKETIIKLPSYKYYTIDKSSLSFFDSLQDTDTLRIFFSQHDCFSGANFDNYAYVVKNEDTFEITYTKLDWETKTTSILLKKLTIEHIKYLKEIEAGLLDSERKGGDCTSNPTFFFELNRNIRRHEIRFCNSLLEIIEGNKFNGW